MAAADQREHERLARDQQTQGLPFDDLNPSAMPSAQSLMATADKRERERLVRDQQTQGLPFDDARIDVRSFFLSFFLELSPESNFPTQGPDWEPRRRESETR